MRAGALICRSYYSLLRGMLPVERLIQKAREYGYGAVALADVNSMSGLIDFCKAADQAHIKPIAGVEILTDTEDAFLLAENRKGYENLCRITSARNLDPGFSLVAELRHNCKGVLCVCDCPRLIEQLKPIFSKDCLFAACNKTAQRGWIETCGIRPVACSRFDRIDDSDVLTGKVVARIRQLSTAGSGPADPRKWHALIPEKDFRKRFRRYPQAIANAEELVQRCSFKPTNARWHLPKVRPANGHTADQELARLCHVHLARKYRPARKEIISRLERELAVIHKSRFSDYFLVVHRIVNFAKEQNIPVEVRGSAAGSLVSHLLGFTRVCPIANSLYFERFMNPGRRDCPDIDIDLCWRRRDDVIRFCYDHWGVSHVAMICNINRYRRRSAIRDVGRFLGLAPQQIGEIAKDRRPDVDSGVYKLAERIMGFPRHLGVHCGGIVITPRPIRKLAPLEWATKGVVVTQYDKDAAEAAGLVKIDLLGNRSLSTVNEAVHIVQSQNIALDIDGIERADRKTASMLSAGDSMGVFQCESPGMRQMLRGLKIRNQRDTAVALSLIRPGPASGGMKNEYIERHLTDKQFTYLHPRMKDVLGETYGVMLYQEDVMRIAVEVAGYDMVEANQFRSEVSKKVSSMRLQQQYRDFVYTKAPHQGIDRHSAEAIWEQILKFAAYSYCKAHATVYGNIAWQTAFLKAHYPREFYTSLFNNHQGMYPLRVYVWDAMRHGIGILRPHVNYSDIEWSLRGKAIRAGLNIIKGLRLHTMQTIIEQRAVRPFESLDDLRRRVPSNRPEMQNLVHIGACDGLGESRPVMLLDLHRKPVNPNQLMLFDIYGGGGRSRWPEYDRVAKLKAEVDVTGIPFTMHPANLLQIKHTPAKQLGKHVHRRVLVAGFAATARTAKTADGKTMGFVTVEDASGLAEVSFFPDRIEQYRRICSAGGPVWIRGKVTEHLSSVVVEGHDCGTCK